MYKKLYTYIWNFSYAMQRFSTRHTHAHTYFWVVFTFRAISALSHPFQVLQNRLALTCDLFAPVHSCARRQQLVGSSAELNEALPLPSCVELHEIPACAPANSSRPLRTCCPHVFMRHFSYSIPLGSFCWFGFCVANSPCLLFHLSQSCCMEALPLPLALLSSLRRLT